MIAQLLLWSSSPQTPPADAGWELTLIVALGVCCLVAVAWALAATRIAKDKERECERLKACIRILNGETPEISPQMADRIMADIFAPPVKAPRYDYPLDLIVGTPSHPVVLDRGGKLDDRAVASTLDDLVRSTGGRL